MNCFAAFPGRITLVLALAPAMLLRCRNSEPESLTIAVSANMQYAAAELVRSFELQHSIVCEMVVGSSGKFTAQITAGAPFDVFLSADLQYPEVLHRNGMTEGAPIVYAQGKLVLWTVREGLEPSIATLGKNEVKHIALPNPKTAPYGTAAVAALNEYGIFDVVKEKLVYGESIGQATQFVLTGAAEMGFTSKSVVLSGKLGDNVAWQEIDDSTYAPISQGMVIIAGRTSNVNRSKKFADFLLSEQGKDILRAYGYATD